MNFKRDGPLKFLDLGLKRIGFMIGFRSSSRCWRWNHDVCIIIVDSDFLTSVRKRRRNVAHVGVLISNSQLIIIHHSSLPSQFNFDN